MREQIVNSVRMTVLSAFGLGLVVQVAPAAAWTQWYAQNAPYASVPGMWFYQNIPTGPIFGPGQSWQWYYPTLPVNGGVPRFWQYQATPFGSNSLWSAGVPTSGLYVEQNETPAGYTIRVRHATARVPSIEVDAAGRSLTISSRSMTGWSTQSISLPGDADVAGMQMQPGDGVVMIFIPRGR